MDICSDDANKMIVLNCGNRVLKSNNLSGVLDIGNAGSNHLQLIDLENNTITGFTQKNNNYKISVV